MPMFQSVFMCVNVQARHFKQNGEIYVARFRLVMMHVFDGLPSPPDADFSLSFSSGSLSDWKQRLFYGERGDDWCVCINLENRFFTYTPLIC